MRYAFLVGKVLFFYIVNQSFKAFRHPFVFMIYKLFSNFYVHITHVKIT